jgi:hypothetical protein
MSSHPNPRTRTRQTHFAASRAFAPFQDRLVLERGLETKLLLMCLHLQYISCDNPQTNSTTHPLLLYSTYERPSAIPSANAASPVMTVHATVYKYNSSSRDNKH